MVWKASGPHRSGSMGGRTHFDVYHTNAAGKRDQPHSRDLKISGEPHRSSMRDIHSSKSYDEYGSGK